MSDLLSVTWSMSSPPASASSEYSWLSFQPSSDPLDAKLYWPSGTLSILNHGFHCKLGRFTAWNISPTQEKEAFIKAASVFKRGVPIVGRPVETKTGTYNIKVSNKKFQPPTSPMVIDKNVQDAWSIDNGYSLVIELDELSKTLSSICIIIDFLKTQDPELPVYLVGGGIVCDTAAFACALLGRSFILVPTTLLGMVDACIGGKTGVNFPPFGKNQLGLFSFPMEVQVFPSFLKTLAVRQYKAGLAECMKHALLNKELFSTIDSWSPQHLTNNLPAILKVKAETVAKDPGEQGERATLNLGHTLAHSLEAVSHSYKSPLILHGEAVAVGLLMSLFLSSEATNMPEASFNKAIAAFKTVDFLPQPEVLEESTGPLSIRSKEFATNLYSHILRDKKMDGTESQWVLLNDIGKVARYSDRFTIPISQNQFESCYLKMIDFYFREFG